VAAIARGNFGPNPFFHQLPHVMNKKFLLRGAALGAALAGTTATKTPIVEQVEEVATKVE
jgi:hypothetical protein